ncbi:LOW QUALITY PROTEIN: E3 ubiquitin-protein ligase MARCHF5 [Drosophila elegans]|uniref:LOW QUALITY PROTEIN: E3 ubiquitin-protein ligase MARCHF5 n=1 Tax=Drosophila elegans TaxID=30023 RepID=UPI001BC846C4|nr:LOW QUALITY PROTEIN: E3 ubiquitin-protein ligase MARCHF5 [Drosophila elegans]
MDLQFDIDQMDMRRSSGGSIHRSADRFCWICFAGEEDNPRAKWVRPCRCRGATMWVHQSCLCRWIDEKQRGGRRTSVVCQQCQTEYIVVFPRTNCLASALDWLDRAVRRTCPYLAVHVLMWCVYWTATTYGAVTVFQVVGHRRALELMESEVFLLLGLPLIPVGLVLGRLVRWQDAVLKVMRSRYNILRKLPFFRWAGEPETAGLDPALSDSSSSLPPLQNTPVLTDPLYISRLFCGAVFLPTLATAMGNMFFKRMEDPLQRTLLGGITYIGAKGLLKIYLRQKLYIRRRKRRIVDYTDENVRIHMGGQAREAPPVQSHQNPQNRRQFAGFDESYEDSSSVITTDSEGASHDSDSPASIPLQAPFLN